MWWYCCLLPAAIRHSINNIYSSTLPAGLRWILLLLFILLFLFREQLRSIFNVVVEVNILDSKDEANLRLLQRPELGVTFTKLHCWRLTQFEKCVFLDADTLVRYTFSHYITLHYILLLLHTFLFVFLVSGVAKVYFSIVRAAGVAFSKHYFWRPYIIASMLMLDRVLFNLSELYCVVGGWRLASNTVTRYVT